MFGPTFFSFIFFLFFYFFYHTIIILSINTLPASKVCMYTLDAGRVLIESSIIVYWYGRLAGLTVLVFTGETSS